MELCPWNQVVSREELGLHNFILKAKVNAITKHGLFVTYMHTHIWIQVPTFLLRCGLHFKDFYH